MHSKKITILLLAIMLGLILIFLFLTPDKKEKKSEVNETEITNNQDLVIGGTYLRTRSHPEDPFDQPMTDTLMILDIKDDYVKFTPINHIKDTSRFWLSSPKKYLEGLKRIK